MTATRTTRSTARRAGGATKRAAPKHAPVPARPLAKPSAPQMVLYRLCKPGWAVIVEKTPNAQGTRFVCPFCPLSHRVPGPVRGFKKVRRAQWVKFRRVEE